MSIRIAFGGGCHWCTEAVFQALIGVEKVEQGWIASSPPYNAFSEAVIVHFDATNIDLRTLIAIHLYTHSCTSMHSMRKKYRSAVYVFSEKQQTEAATLLTSFQAEFDKPIVTQVLPFVAFKENQEKYQNYYQKNANNQFCQIYINPKFQFLMKKFKKNVDVGKVNL